MSKRVVEFECEICGARFKTERSARICETVNPLPPTPFKVGDKIRIRDDGGPSTDTIVGIRVLQWLSAHLQGWIDAEGEDAGEAAFLKRVGTSEMHQRVFDVTEHHCFGGDETTVIHECHLVSETPES